MSVYIRHIPTYSLFDVAARARIHTSRMYSLDKLERTHRARNMELLAVALLVSPLYFHDTKQQQNTSRNATEACTVQNNVCVQVYIYIYVSFGSMCHRLVVNDDDYMTLLVKAIGLL